VGVLDFPDLIPPRPKASAFMALDDSPKFVKPNVEPYWERLTVDALKVYESIYEAASDPKTSLVNCKFRLPLRPAASKQSKHHHDRGC
jgi:hypothetical protein